MIRSLSVLLPVHNVQSSLWASAHEILDVLAELTSQFELLIVDDGSTDGTWDVARELAQLYPQVRLLRESVRQHVVESLRSKFRRGEDSKCVSAFGSEAQARSERRTHVRYAQGDVVITHDGRSAIDTREIVRLWRSLLAPTPAPKFLAAARATNTRSVSARDRSERRLVGFSILRPLVVDQQRREATTSGVW